MQTVSDIKRHIRAVEQTRKLTNAMHLIASARMRKLMPAVAYNHTYMSHLESAMHHILEDTDTFDLPYLRDRGTAHKTFIVMAGDKGMVGAYNEDVCKFALQEIRQAESAYLVTVGLAGTQFFLKNGMQPDVEIAGATEDPSLDNARHMTQDMFRLYDQRVVDRVYVIYTDYISAVRRAPVMRQLLPIDVSEFKNVRQKEEMIYHPSPEATFRLLVPQYTLSVLYGALMKSGASELAARMNAMDSATRNADEILGKLSAQFNLARQAAITQEITELMGSAMAQTAREVQGTNG